MKKLICLSVVLSFFSTVLFAQNLLSPAWKISFSDISAELQNPNNTDHWENVNLLLSWERQGYFQGRGKCCLANKFVVPEHLRDSDFILTLSLQCHVESIYINGKPVGGDLPNQFWSNRDAQTVYHIPQNMLGMEGDNFITVFAKDLSYTGGKSHNLCQLTPVKSDDYAVLKIAIPTENHLYSTGDRNAAVHLEYKARREGSIELFIVSDFHDTLVHKTFQTEPGEGTIPFNFTEEITQPGFYECTAIMKDVGFAGDVRWFTLSPEDIICSPRRVPGFNEYWEDAMVELKKTAPEFNIRKVDSLSTGSRDGYIAEMKSIGGLTIRGYYFVPRTTGKHAAILHLPGYGYDFDHGKPFLQSQEDVIELAICVRGHGISADVFNPGFGLPGIWGYKLCSPKENAYRSIYMDCVRAVEFLLSRPKVDTHRIGVMGGSQGGGLTLATAALCQDKINACAFFDPFMCDTRDQLKIRVMCNREINSFLEYYHHDCSFEEALGVQDLIDTKGFAQRIQCPVLFTTALFDDDCPPHMGFAAYNLIKSPKQYKIYPDDSHLGESDNYTPMRKFLLDQ